ncbi:hypothetical protein JRO89_XS02G0261200 [Xanthoceras sorbifolium]|uniref:Uncharacterized protein n=1 Tax=Xanthoceras sorbifolium TaxID=99658 RepID=A0ABQ8IH30_9ROSI|nr:hypothetical protein JRO89_XS02G0261200 [Xanthoceras sorbifolium]
MNFRFLRRGRNSTLWKISLLVAGSIKSVVSKYQNCRQALLFLVLEIISTILDHLAGSQLIFLLAQFLVSLLVFGATIYTHLITKTRSSATISETEIQLISLEIVFSAGQFIITLVCLIVKANYNSSIFPLIYAAIAVWFTFTNSEEVVSNTTERVFGNEENVDPLQIVISPDNPTNNFVLKNQTGEIRGQPITLRQRKPILPSFEANYNSSVFPLVYAAIAVWFSFINSTEEEISNTTQTVFGNEKNTDPLQQIVISSDNPTSNFVLKNHTGEIRGQPITLRQRKPILPLFEVQEEWNVKLRSISEPNIMPPQNCTTIKVQTSNYLS